MWSIRHLRLRPAMRRDLRILLLTVSFLALVSVALTQGTERSKASRCVEKKSCGKCLEAGPPCGWCKQASYKSVDRCNLAEKLADLGCDYDDIVNPGSEIRFDKNAPPRNGARGEDAIQLSPQEISIKIRPNEPYEFSVSFRQAENYPVDLYYVMDLSNSMADDKAKLASVGNLLASEMNKITENFRLGFGSFVDKKTMPYVSTVPEKLISPCDQCAAPYGFHNQMVLDDNTALFETRVNAARISGNLDSPEGGFDAIMQVIACQREIGWRNHSRKMLLFSTDAGFHYAGDGKLGGIVTPNDGECHLDREGYYSESLNQDYPSISQLVHSIAKHSVNVIFAVTENQVPVYERLSEFIAGSTVGMLADDSANIVELVKDNYKKISGSIELKTEADEDISIQFKTRCLGTEMISGQGSIKCDGLGISQNVTFDVTVQSTSCPADHNQWNKQVKIYPVGLSEGLIVNLQLNCECDCELPKFEEVNSPACNGSGTYECGVCACYDGRFGSKCECDGTSFNSADYEASCKATNTSVPCSGQGQCLCGKCECDLISTKDDTSRRFSGDFCDCNNYNCDYYGQDICGGSDRGTCECGHCNCKTGWEGKNCGCSTDTNNCVAKNKKTCNGHGRCECGVCVCDTNSDYKGPTCEDCPLCAGECDLNWPCVQCRAFRPDDRISTSKLTPEECKANCSHVEVVDELGKNEDQANWRLCEFRDDDNCDAKFEYHYNDPKRVRAQRTKDCPEAVNIWWIILGVILGILLIGLALLIIWKVLITIHDRREFARFEKERENAHWDMGENPIYKQATSTYKNPMYANKS